MQPHHSVTKVQENQIVNDVVNHLGIKVKHFYDRDTYSPTLGGFTVAFRQDPRDSFVTLATAVCSSKERYCRKIGKSLAVNNYLEERTITLPVPKYMTASEVIHMYFYKN